MEEHPFLLKEIAGEATLKSNINYKQLSLEEERKYVII
jgi:hypothetical protein